MELGSFLIGFLTGILTAAAVISMCMKRSWGSWYGEEEEEESHGKRPGAVRLRSKHDTVAIRRGRVTYLLWSHCGNFPDGSTDWRLQPVILPEAFPKDCIYHVFRWSAKNMMWIHLRAENDFKGLDGGEELIHYYQSKLGYDIVANTQGIEVSGEEVYEDRLHAPIGPPPRVIKQESDRSRSRDRYAH